MADLLVSAPADATTGRYHYTQIEQWSRGDDQIIGFLIETWRTNDGATTKSEKRVPGQPARSFDMAQIGVRQVFDAITPVSSSLSAGEVESFVERHGPPSGNPVVLASAISSDNGGPLLATECPPACDVTLRPIVFFDAITSLYRETYLDRAARAALLRLLAVQPGVAFLGEVTDRGGRKAVEVAVAEGGGRFCLLFDRDTGVLLASERSVPGYVLDDYSLYHLLERRDLSPAST
ncbi:hypothetical protein [Catellatospora citrea]|nr:hypothetical protein [Catellatospora citrea]